MERLSVLILDHDPASLLTISNKLTKFNFKVLLFQTVEEALYSLERGVAKDEELDLVVAEIHPGNTAVRSLVQFRHILNELNVPLITMCGSDEAVSQRMALGACFNVVKPLDTETIYILMMRALQHRSTRVIPQGSKMINEIQIRMDSSSTKNRRSETEEDEEQDVLNVNSYSNNLGLFVWSSQLHQKFLQAVEVLGASATAIEIHRYMNVKDLNLTPQHIASHLQKHRMRAQRLSHGEEGYQHYVSRNEISELISSAYKAGSHNNHPTTTQMQFTHGVASSIWDKYPRKLWPQIQMGESSARAGARVSQTNARPPPVVLKHATKSIWDRYDERLQYYDESPAKRFSGPYKRKVLPVKSRVKTHRTNSTQAAGKKVVIDLESNDTRHQDAMDEAHAAVTTPHQVNEVLAAALGSGDLVDAMSNHHPTAEEEVPSDPFPDWEEMEKFWTSQMQGQEQQGLAPEDLLQVVGIAPDDLLQVDDAPMAQEPTAEDAPAYNPVNQFGVVDDVIWGGSPQFAGDDYGMPF